RDLREKFVRQAEWIGRKMEREIQAEMDAKRSEGGNVRGEYERGLQDAREAIEAGIENAEAQRAQRAMPDVADKGRVITGLKIARGLVVALQRGERPYWRE